MKALGPDVEEPREGRRQHVLAGVLLHVEAAGQSIAANGPGTTCRSHVHDRPGVLVEDVHDPGVAEETGVEWPAPIG